MIISASRRTDIPAFYSQWILNRLKEGYALVQNPRNPQRLGRVELSPDHVDCIVFWTKNPQAMLARLGELDRMGYRYYFEFTLTPYDRHVERNLPPKERLVNIFQQLGSALGPDRVDWRYDPIVITPTFPPEWHLERFEQLCGALHAKTRRCIISFVDQYRHVKGVPRLNHDDILAVAEGFSRIARRYGLPLFTCAEAIALEQFGIGHAACIDKGKIESIIGEPIEAKRDTGQRPACQCIASVDIGAYDTCPHGCTYCYATTSAGLVAGKMRAHAPQSPLLTGFPLGDEVVTDRTSGSQKLRQLSLFSIMNKYEKH